MATLVYLLCALTSLGYAGLLLRAYHQNRVRLLLWSGLCFVGLGLKQLGSALSMWASSMGLGTPPWSSLLGARL